MQGNQKKKEENLSVSGIYHGTRHTQFDKLCERHVENFVCGLGGAVSEWDRGDGRSLTVALGHDVSPGKRKPKVVHSNRLPSHDMTT